MDKVRNLINEIEKKYDETKFGEDGLPKSKSLSALSYGYAIYGKEIIKSIINKSPESFEKNINLWSKLKMRAISASDTPNALLDLDNIVLYDIALGEGLSPKIDSPFIPKGIIENGYWNKPR